MEDYQYRYSSSLNDRIISEAQFLLSISSSKGKLFDNLTKKEVEPLPLDDAKDCYRKEIACTLSFVGDTCTLEPTGKIYKISELLALIESAQNKVLITNVKVDKNFTNDILLLAGNLNPDIKFWVKGIKVQKEIREF